MDHHRAYDATLLISGIQNVKSYVAWNNFLLVSLNNRDLIKFQITGDYQKLKYQVKQVDIRPKFTKKPITQMEVIKPVNKLLVLHGNVVEIYELKTIKLQKVLCKKNAVLFSYNKKKSLCISTKKELWIFKWKELGFEKHNTMAIPEAPKTMDWFKASKICLGFKRQYCVINLKNGTFKSLFTTGKNGIPISTKISNQEILLGKDKISIFKDPNGMALRAYGINWVEIPLKIVYFPPYLIGFFANKLRVRTLYTKQLIQDLNIPNPNLCFSMAKKDNHSFAYIANKKGIWRLDEIPLLYQIDMLSFEKNYEEALKLCELIPNLEENKKNTKSNDIKQQYANHLFVTRKFNKAMDFFQQSNCDPRIVLSLYPFLVEENLEKQLKIPFFEQTELNEQEQHEAILSLIDYLTQQRSLINDKEIERKEQILKIIDTTIVKAYIKTNYLLVKHFLKLPNSCDLEQCEKLLKENNYEDEIILLYQSNGKHLQALELISKKINETSNIDDLFEYLNFLDAKNLDLIFKYAKEIYKYDSKKCLLVFLNNKGSSNRTLPPDQVKKYLEDNIPDLLMPYLESIIYEEKDNTPDFNNHLLILYFQEYEKLKTNLKKETENENLKQLVESKNEIQTKMNKFIKTTHHYQAEKMLTIFPEDDLLEERAILLSRVKQHELALDIYINKLNNIEKAEKYCHTHYKPDSNTENIYIILIKQLLFQLSDKSNINKNDYSYNRTYSDYDNNYNDDDEEEHNLKLQTITRIMKKYYSKIDPLKIIPILPNNIPISNIFDYLNLRIKNILKLKRRKLVQKNLHKSNYLNLRLKNSKKGGKSLTIDENTLCQVCGKRIGDSIIGIFPNGVFAHLSCIENKNKCPKTKQDFTKKLNKYY
ncbi:cnh domain containing [Anaeramoeba flamelloides]|uniref:Cnh domain containing n=1 Tax=Anaeramoeba flamelloides TaxID=1746091 RepID=A0AAV8A2V4_9EUKA|nr:cnh domain containing [Anaeramoeba flamelloides]